MAKFIHPEDQDFHHAKHIARRMAYAERPAHTSAGKRADQLQAAANFRLAAQLDPDGSPEFKALAKRALQRLAL